MTGRPRVLWVTAEPPHHRTGGGAMRQAHLIDGLAPAADVDLLVVGPVEDGAVRAAVRSLRELPAPPSGRRRLPRRVHDAVRLARMLPSELADRSGERAVLAAALADPAIGVAGCDVVHAEHLGLAGLVPPGPAGSGPLLSLGVQNVPSVMAAEARAVATGPRQRAYWAAEGAAARRLERRAVAGADVVVAVSDADAAALAAGRVIVAPNGVDPSRYRPGPLPDAPRLVFTGTLDFLPNVDGVTWFATEVLPLVRRAVPAATLDVVGRRPVAGVRALASLPGVTVSADVASTAPHLGAARVAVVPVRIGSGSRLKALEAMAAGRPVAGTTVGLGGIGLEPGTHAEVADGAADLAAAVVRLITDGDRAARMAGEARRFVEEQCSWSAIGARFAAELLSLLPARSRPGPSSAPSP
ncbi:MAG TPA: glycosyltransferase [Acidimicrobiales bacterium]|nr:glycosyltransferase [Acidimicrobiales bacterium]